jgi:hypothetical protein
MSETPQFNKKSWVCRCTSAIPALRKLRQKNYEFKANLGYIVRPYLKKKKKKQTKSKKKY